MAASAILYTPGAGGKAHAESLTIGANTADVPYAILFDPRLPSYTASSGAVLTTTAASHMLQLMAGSSLNVRIRRVRVTELTPPAAVSALELQIVRLTTAGTGGGAITASKKDNGDAAAGATGMTLPTAKGTEGTIFWDESCWLGTTAIPIVKVWEWIQPVNGKPLIIPAGTANGIALKNIGGIATSTLLIEMEFDESSYV